MILKNNFILKFTTFLFISLWALTSVISADTTKNVIENSEQKEKTDEKENNTEETEEENDFEVKLKTPELMKQFLATENYEIDSSNHFFVNVIMGSLAGSAVGAMGSLSIFENGNRPVNKKNAAVFSGAGGILGLASGIAVAFFEDQNNKKYTIGKPLMEQSVMGCFIGGFIGALAGTIPYGASNDINSLVRYTGYGSLAGTIAGMGVYFFTPSKNTHSIKMNFSFYSKEDYKFNFSKHF
ncbi:MAG: hypothetical protein OEZ13_02570 [Spirochaetia bacterium]|nr:hypothetical protein [Spirochaetia bacterium]